MEFVCKNGELKSLSGVYFIPPLATNIMSVGQLDEIGYKVHIDDGLMTVQQRDGRLMTKIRCGLD